MQLAATYSLAQQAKKWRVLSRLRRSWRACTLSHPPFALHLFGEKIVLPEDTVHLYVVATIHVRAQRLVVTCSGDVVHDAPHPIW